MLFEIKCLIVCYNNIAIFGFKNYNGTIHPSRCIESVIILGDKLINTLENIGYIILESNREIL